MSEQHYDNCTTFTVGTHPPPPLYHPVRATAGVFDATSRGTTDGDTVPVSVLVRFPANVIQWPDVVRVLGVDCPERSEKGRWEAARRFTQLFCLGETLRLEVLPKRDKWGRLLAWVWNSRGERLDLALREVGLGVERLKFEFGDES